VKTYLLSILLAYILTKIIGNLFIKLGKHFNLFTAPDEKSLYPFPILEGYSSFIVFPVFIISMLICLYVNERLPDFYFEESNFFNSLILIMILNIILPVLIRKTKTLLFILPALNTFLAFYNGIYIKTFSEDLLVAIPITFLWFLFFQLIFFNDNQHTGNNLMIAGIVMINLFFVSLFLEQILSSQIFLILGVSILSLRTFTTHPAKIIPVERFFFWYGSVIAYIALHNQLKFTLLALFLMIPLANLINTTRRGSSSFSMSLLKKGIPENEISRIVFILQIIAGMAGFFMIIMKNELISFFVACAIFIVFYILLTQEQSSDK